MLALRKQRQNDFFGGCVLQRPYRDFGISLYRYPLQSRISRHCHETAYVSFVLQGSYTELSESGAELLVYNTAVLHGPGEIHADQFHDEEVVLLAIQFTHLWCQRAADSGIRLTRTKAASLDVNRIARKLHVQLTYNDPRAELCVQGLALELTAELLSDDGLIQKSCAARTRDIALSSFRSPITLMTIAEQLQLHPSHVARAFKKRYGMTVGEFIRNARLNHAIRRLSESDDPICIISSESGFYDQSHFTGQFRQAMGTTPATYRARLRDMTRSQL